MDEKTNSSRCSLVVGRGGMFYYEYDPVLHTATRPDGTYEDGMPNYIDNFPESIIEQIVPEEEQAKKIREAFRQIDAGVTQVSTEFQITIHNQIFWFQYHIVARDSKEGRKADCLLVDVTETHMEQAIEKLLLRRQFVGVNIIDVVHKTYRIRFFYQRSENEQQYQEENYEAGTREAAERYIEPKDRELFCHRTSLDTIEEQLAERENYSFTMDGRDQFNNEHLYQYSYYYIDQTKRLILATLEDVTRIVDHDVLTGEYNRNGFIRNAESILAECRDRKNYAILFFNIKGFKAVNELFGIEGGDRILRGAIGILRDSSLKPLLTARFEADHFVVLVERKNLDYDKLAAMCQYTVQINNKEFRLYGRCGIYFLNDNHHDVSGMCDRAKLAKEYITDEYVRPYSIYDQEMREAFVKKRELMSDLEQGVRNQEFEVYYQPVYNVTTGKIVSAEALVRWVHPEYGVVSPGEFILAFEENGYISQLDMLVEDRSKEFILSRIQQKLPMVPIAINLSRMDFYDEVLMEKIARDVQEVKEVDEYCRFEITESAYSSLIDHASGYINTFKEAGVKILLDDFGSGYSSFSTICDFDFDILKLDIGFIQQIGKNAKVECIISNIIHMAHQLKLEIIAEGVETEEQKLFLQQNDCDYIQGYLYSRPLPREQFIELLTEENVQRNRT